VTNEHAHDARGDSKALAECIAAALRRGERLPVCSTPICLSAFSHETEDKWAARGNWIELPDVPKTPRARTVFKPASGVDIRASLKRGSVSETSGRNVRQKTEDDGGEAGSDVPGADEGALASFAEASR
jgi:hypothetical protein